jgi:heme/copper-type cytochrome/quinol oxidase subunit 1
MDRFANTVYYTPYLNVILFCFSIYFDIGHPEVYVIIIPAFGVISDTLCRLIHTSISGHLGMIIATVSISVVGFYV